MTKHYISRGSEDIYQLHHLEHEPFEAQLADGTFHTDPAIDIHEWGKLPTKPFARFF
ncbi:hypothetical protein [Sphaerotilus montanus]|uniref:hypothetical protein n=1 Tax=Sphaerotilus montanus TaxID=522889 RepID=UPI003FA1BD9E